MGGGCVMGAENRQLPIWATLLGLLGFSSLVSPMLLLSRGSPTGAESKTPNESASITTKSEAQSNIRSDAVAELDGILLEYLGKTSLPTVDVPELDVLFLIAPDPVDSATGYQFNAVINSVQLALATQNQNYVLDRFVLPWKEHSQGNAQGTPEHHHKPGLLLFRGKQGLMLVYVIGETPTAGIHKESLRVALKHHQRLHDLYAWGVSKQIRIVGPCFTGSAHSLSVGLANDESGEPIQILSPATGIDSDGFREKVKATWPDREVTLLATNVHVELCYQALLSFVKANSPIGSKEFKIAWLRESSTGYGIAARSDMSETYEFPFPVHIARIRSEYDRRQRSERQAVPDVTKKSSRLNLDVPFDNELNSANDVVPAFAAKMNSATAEYALAQICQALRREQFKYVGITATDVRDRMFLASIVHQYCPEAQLMVVGGDLLLTHPDYSSALRGALVASSYPLFAENQIWTAPFRMLEAGRRQQVVFTNNSIQGYYNAVLLTLFPETWRIEQTQRANQGNEAVALKLPLAEYSAPFRTRLGRDSRPPVWISLIGQDGLWPLKFEAIEDVVATLKDQLGRSAKNLSGAQKKRDTLNAYTAAVKPGAIHGLCDTECRDICECDCESRCECQTTNQAKAQEWAMTVSPRGSCVFLIAAILLFAFWHLLMHVPNAPWESARGFQNQKTAPDGGLRFGRFGATLSLYIMMLSISLLLAIPVLVPIGPTENDASDVGWSMTLAGMPSLAAVLVVCLWSGLGWLQFPDAKEPPPIKPIGAWLVHACTQFRIWLMALVILALSGVWGRWMYPSAWVEAIALAEANAIGGCLAAVLLWRLRSWSNFQKLGNSSLICGGIGHIVISSLAFAAWRSSDGQLMILRGMRAVNVQSGVSLFVPIVMLCGFFYIISIFRLRRSIFLGSKTDFGLVSDEPHANWNLAAFDRALRNPLAEVLNGPNHGLATLTFLGSILWVVYLWYRATPIPDGPWWSLSFGVVLTLTLVVWLNHVIVSLFLFFRWRDWLRELGQLPFVDAFEQSRLPEGVSRHLRQLIPGHRSRSQLPFDAAILTRLMNDILESLGRKTVSSSKTAKPTEIELLNRFFAALFPQLQVRRSTEDQFPELSLAPSSDDKKTISPQLLDRRRAEQFCAIHIVFQISQRLGYLRDQLLATVLSCLVLLFAVGSYPFHPAGLLKNTGALMVLSVMVLTFVVFLRIERDAIISRVAGSKPNSVSFEPRFLSTMGAWLIPLVIVLVGNIFPDAGRWMFDVLHPLLQSSK